VLERCLKGNQNTSISLRNLGTKILSRTLGKNFSLSRECPVSQFLFKIVKYVLDTYLRQDKEIKAIKFVKENIKLCSQII
jgi:hypothetical protein